MRKHFISFTAASVLTVIAVGLVFSLDTYQNHSGHNHAGSSLPLEGGQSAFVALEEIVEMLEADPNTNWSNVNISALRAHLVDMSELTLAAEAEQVVETDRIVFNIRGGGKTLRAIHAMVPAHAIELDKLARWSVSAETTSNGAILSILPLDAGELDKLSALGFFGIMAIGAHHQAHHLAMAKGTMHAH